MPSGKPLALHNRTTIRRPTAVVDYAWVQRTQPGGCITIPIATGYHPAVTLSLAVQPGGIAAGRFAPLPINPLPSAPGCPCGLGPNDNAAFAVGLMLPTVHRFVLHADDDPATHALWLTGTAGSWAEVTRPNGVAPKIRQGGPRRLWEEVMEAWRRWQELDEPRSDQLGMTITPSSQWVWIGEPAAPLVMRGRTE